MVVFISHVVISFRWVLVLCGTGNHLRCKSVDGGKKSGSKVTVAAGEEAKVTATITLSSKDKKYLDKSFKNGMYVEGFVMLDAQSGAIDLNVPFLAFYGDWYQAPQLDLDYFATNKDELDDAIDMEDKTLPDAYASRPVGGTSDDYVSFLGSYYFVQKPGATPIAADRKYISISNQADTINSLRFVWAGLLRNAKTVKTTIVDDATGEV
ncbi:MAG: Fn3-like domain-containing protein, partial [Spirochaetaceae bacterium]|nr:Fn3-like domain-containing protein [Spirochaetaceae bacterium]